VLPSFVQRFTKDLDRLRIEAVRLLFEE